MDRPSAASLQFSYDALFNSTLDKLRESAVLGRLFYDIQEEPEDGVPGRSIAWKLFLTEQPPLTASLHPYPIPPLDSLRHSRACYVSLLKDKMRAPDGSYEEGFRVPGESTPTPAAPKKPDNWNLNNPLSLHSSNPWHAYFSALDARNTVRQDVERTFPEIPYFRSPVVQNEMTHILFLHASERENIGYRQGMHELLACVYRVVDYDSVERGTDRVCSMLEELCDRTFVAADAYSLFGAIMQRMETWYEWRPPISGPVSPTSPVPHIPHFSANGEMVSPSIPQPQIDVLANGQLDLKPYIAPIVPTCTSLRDEKLRIVDPHLWDKLREGGVEPQLYGMRWLRLLFTREFSLAESMVLWDGLFAAASADPVLPSSSSSQQGFELALWISVAMLIRIRNNLIPGDYTAQLTQMLRYPSPASLGASHHTTNAPALLLTQAQLLMTSPTPSTGASLVMQNRNELGIPVEVPSPPTPSPARRRRSSSTAPPTVSASHSRAAHVYERPRLQDMITNRLMDANETLGIQRGFFNTITELRKNLPDLSQSLIRTSSWNGSTISLVDERDNTSLSARDPVSPAPSAEGRPPWEPRPRSEVEREIAELRVLLKTLGDAVGWAVDVLLLDEGSQESNAEGKTLPQKKAEAVECMAYVRDVLARGGKGEVEEERLVSEEEYQRRRKVKEVAAARAEPPPPPKPVLPPPRVASSEDTQDALGKPRTMLSTRDAARPISSLTRTPVTPNAPSKTTTLAALPNTAFTSRSSSSHAQASCSASTSVKVAPPWQHTPSNFSGSSPFALPRLPPSTAAPPSKPSRAPDPSVSRNSPPSTTKEPPQGDPLGVLR